MSYHAIYNNSMFVSVCSDITDITCYMYDIHMCLVRSLKKPYQTMFRKTVITECVSVCLHITIITHSGYIYAFASFSQKPLLKFIYTNMSYDAM